MEGRTIIINIKTVTNIKTEFTTKTATVTAPALISLYIINYVILYIIKKAVNHRNIPKKNEKSLKLSSGLPIKTSLINLTTGLINDLINIL